MTDYSRVDAEIASGRLWRAKEILTGRLASSNYDPALFGKVAVVLEAMGDDDEAGRFHLLSGGTNERGRELACRFLKRRRDASLSQIWQTMPRAARRSVSSDFIPDSTIDLLRSAEKLADRSQLPILTIADRSNGHLPSPRPTEKQSGALAIGILVISAIALILGLIEIIRLVVIVVTLIV